MASKTFNILLNIIRSFGPKLFNFLIALVAIKTLGENEWGEFLQILVWVYFISFVANFGNKDFLLREFSNNPSTINCVFQVNLCSRLPFITLGLLLFLFFSFEKAILGIILSMLTFVYQSFESLVLYYQKFLAHMLTEGVAFIIIIGALLFINDLQVNYLIFLYCIITGLKSCVLMSVIRIRVKLKDFYLSVEQLEGMIPFFFIGLSGWISTKIDIYIVTISLSKAELAKYQLFITSFLLLRSLPVLFLHPFIKHLFRLNDLALDKIKRIIIYSALPIIIVCTLLIWLILEHITNLNLPHLLYFLGALYSIPIYFFIVDIYKLYRNRNEKRVMFINLSSVILNIVLLVVLIPYFGLIGIVAGIMITQYITLLIYKKAYVLDHITSRSK